MTPTSNAKQIASKFQGCLATSARKLDRVVMRTADEHLRAVGVRSTQVTMLVFIASFDRPTAADLVPAMGIDQTTLSRNIDRLVDLGFVRTLESEDGRTRPLELTAAGTEKLQDALPKWRAAMKQIRGLIGEELAEALAKGL